MNETNLLKQQLEGQINVLKEQINTARMNDEHYDHRLSTIVSEIDTRQQQKRELEEEKKRISEQLESASGQDTEAQQSLIEIQSKIAEHSTEIEQKKREIMDLLGNRASTKAKIQHFDTTKEQIQTRKAVVARNILEISTVAEGQNNRLRRTWSDP